MMPAPHSRSGRGTRHGAPRLGCIPPLERCIASALRRCAHGEPAALVHLEVDGAWDLRDAGGAAATTALAAEVARALVSRVDGPVHRLGGRQCAFCTVLDHTPMAAAVRKAAALKRAVDALGFRWHGHPFRVAACVGVVELGAGPGPVRGWRAAAREACAAARELGGCGVQEVSLDGHAWADLARNREWVRHLAEIIC